ncbi:unnamed protein product [Linum trigynum]|uniref:Uncharacterized protein n=1 Tax=Linum trigynum TaxID=586398 RepID=A0AAV2CDT7_9ROSI
MNASPDPVVTSSIVDPTISEIRYPARTPKAVERYSPAYERSWRCGTAARLAGQPNCRELPGSDEHYLQPVVRKHPLLPSSEPVVGQSRGGVVNGRAWDTTLWKRKESS